MTYNPVTFHVEFPGKFFATDDVWTPQSKHQNVSVSRLWQRINQEIQHGTSQDCKSWRLQQ